MCGICGLIRNSPINEKDISKVNEMNQALVHRGPDSCGFYHDSQIALAMRRLKIIDLVGGDQPLFNEDRSLVLIANGEIYNHIELRKDLEKKGHIFKTHSDCETILHAYEEEDLGHIQSLRGMFAFTLYDKPKKRLLIVRDRLGEKPLYYYRTESELVFSSEIKPLLIYLRSKGIKIKINHNAINWYFHYQFVPEPFTCVDGISKLPAAHYMTISLDDFSFVLKEYWDFEETEPILGDPAKLIHDSFDQLAQIIIRANVPVGISLSGGIDSAAIAAFTAKYYQVPMHAFSVGYSGYPENDERKMAQKLANKLGLLYHEVELKTEDLANSFPSLVYSLDDPIADIAAFGYYSVNKLAKQYKVPVLLSGFGGDELFWGYQWVKKAVQKNLDKKKIQKNPGQRSSCHNGIFSDMLNAARKIGKKQILLHPFHSIKKFIAEIQMENAKLWKNPERFIFYDEVPDFVSAYQYLFMMYTDNFKKTVDEKLLYSFFMDDDWENVPVKVCKFLFQTWLYSNCIALGDRMSMASSVENRLPFLDYRFVELVMGLRKTYIDDYKLGHKKWFIDAMQGIIPDETLNRRKRGFTPPLEEWYKTIITNYGKFCHDGFLASNEIMRKDKVINFIDNTITGKGDLFFSYKIILLEMWCRQFVWGENPG